MRIAVSGSHSTGKSTLIAAFTAKRPEYIHVPEAYEELADEIAILESEGPDVDGLTLLLSHTVSVVRSHQRSAAVIFERSPVDYLAYAAASRSIARAERAAFLRSSVSAVRLGELLRCLEAARRGR